MNVIDGDFLQKPETPEEKQKLGDLVKSHILAVYNSDKSDSDKTDLIRRLWPQMEAAYGEDKLEITYFGAIDLLKPKDNSALVLRNNKRR